MPDGARRPVSPTSANAPWPPRSTVKVARSDSRWPKSRTKSPETPKKSTVNVTRPINAETESVSHIRTSNLVWRLEYELSTAMASYKGLWSWRAGIVSAAPGGHATCSISIPIWYYELNTCVVYRFQGNQWWNRLTSIQSRDGSVCMLTDDVAYLWHAGACKLYSALSYALWLWCVAPLSPPATAASYYFYISRRHLRQRWPGQSREWHFTCSVPHSIAAQVSGCGLTGCTDRYWYPIFGSKQSRHDLRPRSFWLRKVHE